MIKTQITKFFNWANELVVREVGSWHNRAVCPCGYSIEYKWSINDRGNLHTVYEKSLRRCPDCGEPVCYDITEKYEGYTKVWNFYSNWQLKVMRQLTIGPRLKFWKSQVGWQMRIQK